MARKRMIDPSIWQDDGMATLTARQQLLYIGLFSNADDAGRLNGSAMAIRLILPAVYGGVDLSEIEADLGEVLATMDKLIAYQVAGKQYLSFTNYSVWQNINRPSPSKLPPPPTENSAIPHGTFSEPSRLEEKKGIEGNRKETPPAARAGARAKRASAASTPKPPNRVAQVIDAVHALDSELPCDVSARDGAAIKASAAPPGKIAEAYQAVYSGRWGDDWMRDNLSFQLVIARLAGYEAHMRASPRAPRGQTAVYFGDDRAAQIAHYGDPDMAIAQARAQMQARAANKNGSRDP